MVFAGGQGEGIVAGAANAAVVSGDFAHGAFMPGVSANAPVVPDGSMGAAVAQGALANASVVSDDSVEAVVSDDSASTTASAGRSAAPRACVLVVEDDAAINDVVCSTLAGEGFACTPAYSGTEARLLLDAGTPFDLAVCDLMLPGIPGEDVVSLIRGQGPMPILVTSAKATVPDRVSLLRLGADDYLVKPFDLDELVARVEALLRRSCAAAVAPACGNVHAGGRAGDAPSGSATAGSPLAARAAGMAEGAIGGSAHAGGGSCGAAGEKPRGAAGEIRYVGEDSRSSKPLVPAPDRTPTREFGAWRLFEDERRLEVAGEPVRLTRTEFDIVAALMRRPRKVFTKRELYREVWHEDAAVEEKAVNTHISNIRSKLKGTGTEGYIETVWGIGFKLADLSKASS